MGITIRPVRVGPGWLYIALLESDEPADLTAAWSVAWTPLGYTDGGSNFVFESTFEDVVVAEELDPVEIVQTARTATVNFALAEVTGANMQRTFNGGEVTTETGVVAKATRMRRGQRPGGWAAAT